VKQYWDRNRVLSHAMGEHNRPSVVWDYIAVYKPEQIWTDSPPRPEFTPPGGAFHRRNANGIEHDLLRAEKTDSGRNSMSKKIVVYSQPG
jgi:hypothetical protein